jgi:hypothetical protein
VIRKAVMTDIPALVDLSIEALSIDAYQALTINRNRVYQSAKSCVLSAANFCWVSEHAGKLAGAVGAEVFPLGFYDGQQAVIYMWYCKHPGDGRKLMKEFLKWCEERPQIRLVAYCGERNADPRVGKMAMKLGFEEVLPMYVKTR